MGILKFMLGFVWHYVGVLIHKFWVSYYLFNYVFKCSFMFMSPWVWRCRVSNFMMWLWLSIKHDWTKFGWTESKGFAKHAFDLRGLTYGSQEYKDSLEKLRPAIEHHYKWNSHHPEYYENGLDDMTYWNKVEMIADWFAASRRHRDGDIIKSIDINQDRFGYDDEEKMHFLSMVQLMESTLWK